MRAIRLYIVSDYYLLNYKDLVAYMVSAVYNRLLNQQQLARVNLKNYT